MDPLVTLPETLQNQISKYTVPVAPSDLKLMCSLAQSLHRLTNNQSYVDTAKAELPPSAQFDPSNESVMMGYDFHLTNVGPKLIEVNTNAGGAVMAWSAANKKTSATLDDRSIQRFIYSFKKEFQLYCSGSSNLKSIAIIDEDPTSQFLYPEMKLYAELFSAFGIDAVVVAPSELQAGEDGVSFQGKKIDLIYNRHCDFYLESEELSGVKDAYLNRAVCLTPNPRQYGLLADKRRMILWGDPTFAQSFNVASTDADVISRAIPKTRLLADCDLDEIWQTRKNLIFKPIIGFGSKGVLAGRKISRKRFDELHAESTLAQEYCPPSTINTEDGEMKVDIRVFTYANRLLGFTARIYQGQVTNMRTPGGGFAAVMPKEKADHAV